MNFMMYYVQYIIYIFSQEMFKITCPGWEFHYCLKSHLYFMVTTGNIDKI